MGYFSMILSHLGVGGSMSSMKKVSFEIALKGKKQIAEGTWEFVFEKPKGFSFKAGQHVRMTLLNPPETDIKGNSRFLTLANTPEDKDLIVAMRMSDSAFKRVLGQMKIGEEVLIQILLNAPHRAFALDEDSTNPTVFLVGGIGIVPAYSMIKESTDKKLPQKIFLFYSNRRPEDAPYLQDFKSFEKQNPNFKLIATMTEPEKSKTQWKGEIGFINKAMLEKYISDLKSPIYYIAGLSGMVNAMKTLVNDIGVSEDNIKAEDFDGMKMGQMDDAMKNVKSYLLPAAIALIVVIGILAHAGIGISLFHSNYFKNISFLTVGLILMIIVFKVLVIFKLKSRFQGREKHI
jgi:ferredoxin-NADP reductase